MSFNETKRSFQSSSNSDSSPLKKKTKIALKRSFDDSSSSSDDNGTTNSSQINRISPSKSVAAAPAPPVRSSSTSSNDSNGSDEIVTKKTRQRRRKPAASTERSNILNQIKRKAQERKATVPSPPSAPATTDNNNNSSNGTKKSQFQFSDEDEDEVQAENPNDDGDTTESYDVDTMTEDIVEEPKPKQKLITVKNEPKRQNVDEESKTSEENSPSKKQTGTPTGRKNIRKILDDKELDIQTKHAVEAELERRKRIAEKQREYNEILLEQSKEATENDDEDIFRSNRRLILELDSTKNESLIEVSPKLVQFLKPHQCDGIRFLWNNVFESIEAIQKKKSEGSGCILAHCMGLGKTLQVISFIHTILNYDQMTNVKTCLVLCPINAALNWSNEFDYWLNDVEPPVDHYQLTTIKPNLRLAHLNFWFEHGGVMIMGYEMYRRLASGFGLRNKKLKEQAFRCLVDPGPDVIVADEGHILKNAQTALAKCLTKIRTKRRIVLTGTPLQNNLVEYYCMVSFIKPKLLGTQQEYINRFVNPIENGQHRDSSEEDVCLMKRRACVLHELLTGFVDRKDYSLLRDYLPPKFEYIINIRLSDLQTKLYEIYLENQMKINAKKDFKSSKLFADYQYLQKIWTHPFLLYPHFIDHWKKRLFKDDNDLLDDREVEAMFTDNDDDDDNDEKEDEEKDEGEEPKKKRVKRIISDSSSVASSSTKDDDENEDEDEPVEKKDYKTRSRTAEDSQSKNAKKKSNKLLKSDIFDTENDQMPVDDSSSTDENEENQDEPWTKEMREQFWFPFLDMLPDSSEFDVELSGKFFLLKSLLDKCSEIGDKILLFSRSIYTLNYIERFLHYLHQQNEEFYQKQCQTRRELRQFLASSGTTDVEHSSVSDYISPAIQWYRDEDYFRMDGQTDVTLRKRYAQAFNDPSNTRARLFLISTLAGGIGINLVGSNRVIVFDASWNPSHDTQAIFRSYRFGQKKPVYIYRFLAQGTMEEKIYQRQVVKQSLAHRVIDDQQLDRHFTENDIKELYKFTPEPLPEAKPTSNEDFNYQIPKDHLLLDLLYEHQRWIHSYHSHDSLLENKLDEGLSEEERRRALEEYENLKRPRDSRTNFHQGQREQSSSNASSRNQLPQIQQMYLNFLNAITTDDQQTSDYAKMLQYAYEIGFGQPLPDVRVSLQRSNLNLTTDNNPGDVFVVESDDDDDNVKKPSENNDDD